MLTHARVRHSSKVQKMLPARAHPNTIFVSQGAGLPAKARQALLQHQARPPRRSAQVAGPSGWHMDGIARRDAGAHCRHGAHCTPREPSDGDKDGDGGSEGLKQARTVPPALAHPRRHGPGKQQRRPRAHARTWRRRPTADAATAMGAEAIAEAISAATAASEAMAAASMAEI